MTQFKPLGPLVFDADFTTATDGAGVTIRFTRSERRLLTYLHAHPRIILSRDRLLDGISGAGSEKNDRNIDYLVNRLRRKLRDSAHAPQFIQTHYGEGYEWIGEAAVMTTRVPGIGGRTVPPLSAPADPPDPAMADASLRDPSAPHTGGPDTAMPDTGGPDTSGSPVDMGEVGGVAACDRYAPVTEIIVNALRRNIAVQFAEPPARPFGTVNLRSQRAFDVADGAFRLDVSFLELDRELTVAVLLRRVGLEEGTVLGHESFTDPQPDDPQLLSFAEASVTRARQRLWQQLSENWSSELSGVPTAVALHRAAEAVGRPEYTWRENETRLRALLAQQPDDAKAQLLLATALHTKYIINGVEVLMDADPRAADMAEMARLVRSALPGLDDNPIQALTAAKILWFSDTAARAEAFEIAERAFHRATSFGAACALMGQMHMWQGDPDRGLTHFRKALAFTGTGGQFHLYTLVMICQAFAVKGGARAGEDAVLRDLFSRDPRNLLLLSLYYTPPADLEPTEELTGFIDAMRPAQITALLRNVTFASVRLFEESQHQRRLLERPYRLITSRRGRASAPPEVEAVMNGTGRGW